MIYTTDKALSISTMWTASCRMCVDGLFKQTMFLIVMNGLAKSYISDASHVGRYYHMLPAGGET